MQRPKATPNKGWINALLMRSVKPPTAEGYVRPYTTDWDHIRAGGEGIWNKVKDAEVYVSVSLYISLDLL
jgi:hypothetical protein